MKLRFANRRHPFETLRTLGPAEKRQLALITANAGAGKPESLVDDDDWSSMELFDIVDATKRPRFQLFMWPGGSGILFRAGKTASVGRIVQHALELEPEDADLRRALESAQASANPKPGESIDFATKPRPSNPDKPRAAELSKVFPISDERFLLFDKLTPTEQALVRDAAGGEPVEFYKLVVRGLPPWASLLRWSGQAPATLLERTADTWPVWKWLKAATRDEVETDRAIAAVCRALSATEIADLCMQVSTPDTFDEAYDLFGKELNGNRGEAFGNPFAVRVIRLLAALVDASGNDAALGFATRVERQLASESQMFIGAIATFALAARARRRGEAFPKAFYTLAAKKADSLPGRKLREGMRDIVELIPMEDRDAFLEKFSPWFMTSSLLSIDKGKERKVPCLLHGWLYADLCPTDRVARGMVENIARWDRDPKPVAEALAMVTKVGAICVPHLEEAMKTSKSKVLADALTRLTGTPSTAKAKART
jgi:hypothetical protein